MFRQSPGRSHRSKGIKVKHVLQICFLLAICFWLAYQVKHSHDKKKEFDASDEKVSLRMQSTSGEVLNLGRKDLRPKVEETATVNKKQVEGAEEEEIIVEEEENKHEEEPDQGDHKLEVKDDDARAGDEEIDENEQEKSDMDPDREEDVIDEEKDKEEGNAKETEQNDLEEKLEENSSEEHDNDEGTAKNAHEAREEHYKADDASSAVTHESQTVTDENENQNKNGNSDNSNEPKLSNENEVDNTENDDVENTANRKTQEREMIENGSPFNITDNGASEDVASKSEITSTSSAFVEHSEDHPSVISNTDNVITRAGESSLHNGTETQNTYEESAESRGTNGDGSGVETIALDQLNNTSLDSGDKKAYSESEISTKAGDTDSSSGHNSESHDNTDSFMSDESTNSTDLAKVDSLSSTSEVINVNEDHDSHTGDDTALKIENPDEVQNDPIDSSDSSNALEKVRTDLETLPEIQTEASNSEDIAAE